jgi:hypothetical protein
VAEAMRCFDGSLSQRLACEAARFVGVREAAEEAVLDGLDAAKQAAQDAQEAAEAAAEDGKDAAEAARDDARDTLVEAWGSVPCNEGHVHDRAGCLRETAHEAAEPVREDARELAREGDEASDTLRGIALEWVRDVRAFVDEAL